MAWGPIWKRQDDAQLCVCAEPGCTRRAELQRRCWHCGRRFCPAHILEQVDEHPPRKALCLDCAAAAGWL
jgi:hypothetical protein